MSIRKSRRAVIAELVLLAGPTDFSTRHDGVSLSIDFGSIADLRSWLRLAGLNSPDVLTGVHDGITDDGRRYRSMHAYPTWHGWKIYAHAIDYTDPVPLLDPQTTEQLAALATAGGVSG